MSLIHDIIKIKYTRLGYLPNYPYHLISDAEMFDAFINLSGTDDSSGSSDYVERFFTDYYPNPFYEEDIIYVGPSGKQISLSDEYNRLKQYIITTINDYLSHLGNIVQVSEICVQNSHLILWFYRRYIEFLDNILIKLDKKMHLDFFVLLKHLPMVPLSHFWVPYLIFHLTPCLQLLLNPRYLPGRNDQIQTMVDGQPLHL
jgi:hypothetical protein